MSRACVGKTCHNSNSRMHYKRKPTSCSAFWDSLVRALLLFVPALELIGTTTTNGTAIDMLNVGLAADDVRHFLRSMGNLSSLKLEQTMELEKLVRNMEVVNAKFEEQIDSSAKKKKKEVVREEAKLEYFTTSLSKVSERTETQQLYERLMSGGGDTTQPQKRPLSTITKRPREETSEVRDGCTIRTIKAHRRGIECMALHDQVLIRFVSAAWCVQQRGGEF